MTSNKPHRIPRSSPAFALLCTLFCTLLLPPAALGEVFRVVDENGNVTYTDNPPADHPATESVDLPAINTQPAPALKKATDTAQATAAVGYERVSITAPANNSTVTPGQLTVPVQVTLEPALQQGHSIQLWYDNQPYSEPRHSTIFQVSGLERGEHSLYAKVLDGEGSVIASSNNVTIHVKRASALRRPASSSN